MTKNQLEYNKLLETKRANLASERLTAQRDEAARRLGLANLEEVGRHNVQVELQARDNLAEQQRSNRAQEMESQRAHLASEGIQQQQADTARLTQQEAGRHNKVAEDLHLMDVDVSRLGAELGASSRLSAAGISASAAQYASDLALLGRQLEVGLGERRLASEVGLRTAQLSEQKREAVARQQEINRSNRVSEAQKGTSLMEQIRNNVYNNLLNQRKINVDLDLRGRQLDISQQQADTQRAATDANISLVPSQKFSNYARGASAIVSSIAKLAPE